MENHRENLIVSADDFGMGAQINGTIASLAQAGKIKRVAVAAKGNFTKEEIEEISKLGIKIDIHLTLPNAGENATHPGKAVAKRSLLFLLLFLSGKASPAKVKKEWENQIAIFLEKTGRYPDGINSHEHVHFFPPYFKIAIELARRFGISYIRFGKKTILKNGGNAAKIISLLRKINVRRFDNSNLDSSDYLTGLDWTSGFEKFLKKLPEGKTEVVCHPEIKKDFEILMKYF